MAPNAFKALCLVVHFLINESHGSSQRVPASSGIINLRNRKGDQKDDDSHGIGKIASGVLRKTDSELPKPVFSTGVIIGAVLGGAVFGSVITMIVFLCFCQTRIDPQNRNSDSKPESDETLQEHLRPGDNENVYSEINDHVFIQLQQMGRSESVNVPLKEGTYNHLYESDKEDMNESYDHAKSVPSSRAGKDGHVNLTSVVNNSREDNTECGKSMTATVCQTKYSGTITLSSNYNDNETTL